MVEKSYASVEEIVQQNIVFVRFVDISVLLGVILNLMPTVKTLVIRILS